MKSFLITILTLVSMQNLIAADPNQIVQKADLRRGLGTVSHSFEVKITNSNGKTENHKVYFQDVEKTLVEQTSPERAKGRKLLMNGYDMWLFTQNIKKPVRISLDQKMTGEVSNGDIARTNYAQDYEAKIILEDDKIYKLDLTSKNNKVTYGKIEYIVEKKSFKPIEATFFALSGKALKKAEFSEFKIIDGIERSTRMTISDFIQKNRTSIIDFYGHKKETFNNTLFNKDRLGM